MLYGAEANQQFLLVFFKKDPSESFLKQLIFLLKICSDSYMTDYNRKLWNTLVWVEYGTKLSRNQQRSQKNHVSLLFHLFCFVYTKLLVIRMHIPINMIIRRANTVLFARNCHGLAFERKFFSGLDLI